VTYEVIISRSAEKDMDKLSLDLHTRITRRVLSLESNPRPIGVKKLSGLDEYRLKVGNYQILYTIDDYGKSVTILAVRHRREAYR
jgi:mRNA interferase RelE/StbE